MIAPPSKKSGAAALAEQMLHGPPLPVLLRLASPNALAFLVQAAVSMAEVAIVARLGTVPLAALALMFPGLMLIQMLANGAIGGAVSSAIARALGGGGKARADTLIWHALVIAIAAGVLFFAAWWLFGSALLTLLGASSPVSAAARAYGNVLFTGAALIWFMAMLNSVFRGMGNMRLPALLMIGGAGVQVPLTGALVLGWFGVSPLGIEGAPLAVLLVAALSVAVLILCLQRGGGPIRLRRDSCRFQRALFADIFRVGALSSLSPVFTVLTISLVNALIGGFGVSALAGYGIVARLEFLLVPMVFGLGAAMTALVGTNMGAGNVSRAEQIGWLGGFTAAALTGLIGLVLALFPGLWLNLFTEDPAVWQAGAAYLYIVGPLFAFQGLGLSLYFASQGAGAVAWPVLATALRFLIGVGGAFLVVRVFDLELTAIYVCLAVGMFVYGTLTAAAIRWGAWRRSSSW